LPTVGCRFAFAHDGVVQIADIKPGNLMVTADGRINR
jgi:hypothetical protein